MRLERRAEKIKIEKENEKENEEERIKEERTREVIRIMRRIRKERKVPKAKLPRWLQELLRERAEKIEVRKREEGRNFYLYFGDQNVPRDTIIRIFVKRIEKEPTATLTIRREEEENRFFLKGERAEEIIKEAGFLGMVRDKKGRLVILKKGDENRGFTHIIKKHFASLIEKERKEKETVGEEVGEEVRNLILSCIREAKDIRLDRRTGARIYRHMIEEGKVMRVIVDSESGYVFTAFIEK